MNPKKMVAIASVIGALILAAVIYIAVSARAENAALLKDGIRGEALVWDVFKRRTGSRNSRQCYMKVSIFAKKENDKPVQIDTSLHDINARIDHMFEQMSNIDLGKFETVEFPIYTSSYNKYKKGDHVKVVYNKDDPQKMKLLEELE